jgi:hypothetical protein
VKQTFTEAVGALSPLNGAIDGSARKEPRKARKPAREPMSRSLTFFCSNPQCDHGTWSPVDQARHMAGEFWKLAQAIVRLAPDSREALALTGGKVLNELTDDECRVAAAAYERHRRQGGVGQLPPQVRLRHKEYMRRLDAGAISPLAALSSVPDRRPRNEAGRFARTSEGVRRDAEAAALRRQGRTYEQIAAELGYASKGSAHDAVRRAYLGSPS